MKPGMGNNNNTPITTMVANRIKKWVKPEFDPEVQSYPVGLCMTCRRQLSECEKLGVTSPAIKAKWDAFKLQNIHIPRGQDARTCCCDICSARRTKGKSVKIVPSRGEPAEKEKEKEKKKKEKGPCGICLQEKTGPGIKHPCGPAARKHNLALLTLKEERGAEQVAASVVKGLAEEKTAKPGMPIQLKQMKGGQPLSITLGTKHML